MEKHIDTMGFILAAIVISITLLGEREARRSEIQIQEVRGSLSALRTSLRALQRVSPRDVTEMVRRARVERDVLVRAARLLNSTLIGIVVVVGLDGLRLIYLEDVEHPADAALLVLGLMTGAVVTGAYGEFHARTERHRADREFKNSDLHHLAELSDELAARTPSAKADGLVATIRERFPAWDLLPELDAMLSLQRGDAESAVATLTDQNEAKADGHNFPILLATAMSRTGQMDDCLSILETLAIRRTEDLVLRELTFDLGLANAHRSCLFGAETPGPTTSTESGSDRLSFDLSLNDFDETRELRDFGRAWTNKIVGGEEWKPTSPHHPITWLWALLEGSLPASGILRLREWRDTTKDAAALESIGFGLLAVRQGDEAIEMFDAAIRLNSSSPSGHWGWSLAYFDRSWAEKAVTGLKRARTCGLSEGLFQLTDLWLHKHELPPFDRSAHIFGARPTLQDKVDLSLLGIVAPLPPAETPQTRLAAAFIDAARGRGR